MLLGRDTVLTKAIWGASGRSRSCTCSPVKYLRPGIFCPKGMRHTVFDDGVSRFRRTYAYGYSR